MDSPPPASDQQANTQSGTKSIDSLRTVEFRVTLRGYHIDDVDEYLERVAVEAEQLQEQLRLSADRLKQANDRAATLEQQLEQARRQERARPPSPDKPAERPAAAGEAPEEALSRTLLLAQKFVDQTRNEAEHEAKVLVSDAESRARRIVADAEEHARVMTEESERSLRDEVARLDETRAQLVGDVETIAKHLELERARIRKALTDMLEWVDEHVQPPGSEVEGDDNGPVEPDRGTHPHAQRHSSASTASSASSAPQRGDRGAAPGGKRIDHDAISTTDAEDGSVGAPTQPVASGADTDDQVEADPETLRGANAPRRSIERPGSHQREMFTPSREAHQAGSTSR